MESAAAPETSIVREAIEVYDEDCYNVLETLYGRSYLEASVQDPNFLQNALGWLHSWREWFICLLSDVEKYVPSNRRGDFTDAGFPILLLLRKLIKEREYDAKREIHRRNGDNTFPPRPVNHQQNRKEFSSLQRNVSLLLQMMPELHKFAQQPVPTRQDLQHRTVPLPDPDATINLLTRNRQIRNCLLQEYAKMADVQELGIEITLVDNLLKRGFDVVATVVQLHEDVAAKEEVEEEMEDDASEEAQSPTEAERDEFDWSFDDDGEDKGEYEDSEEETEELLDKSMSSGKREGCLKRHAVLYKLVTSEEKFMRRLCFEQMPQEERAKYKKKRNEILKELSTVEKQRYNSDDKGQSEDDSDDVKRRKKCRRMLYQVIYRFNQGILYAFIQMEWLATFLDEKRDQRPITAYPSEMAIYLQRCVDKSKRMREIVKPLKDAISNDDAIRRANIRYYERLLALRHLPNRPAILEWGSFIEVLSIFTCLFISIRGVHRLSLRDEKSKSEA